MSGGAVSAAADTAFEPPPVPALPPDIETPAAIVDLDIVRANIARMQRHADDAGVALRPHVKTHKSLRIGALQRDAGAKGITAGTVGEVEVFAEAGFDDIFLAYTVWAGGAHGRRLRAMHERIHLRVGLDSVEAADELARSVSTPARPLEVVIEIDCGAGRCGVRPADAGRLAAHAASIGLHPVGAYTYPGHGGRDRSTRRRASDDEVDALAVALAAMAAAGLEPSVASGGSTPTSHFSARGPLTELRPGEYVFNDMDNLRLSACGPADIGLIVATRVVSNAVAGQVMVDVGTKALGREGNDTRGYGFVPAMPGSFLRRLNEYHGYLALPADASPPRVGEVLAVVPNHCCPVVNLFDELVITEAGRVIDVWPVDARGYRGLDGGG